MMINCISCSVCGGNDHFTKWSVLLECQDCGFVFYDKADPDELAKLYDTDYFHGGEYIDYLSQELALRRSMRRHLEQMASHNALGEQLLEIGSAYGFFLDEAKTLIRDPLGIDVASEPVRNAVDRLGVKAVCGDFLIHDFGNATFDNVCMWDTIEHLTRPDKYVQRAADLLKSSGYLFITTGDLTALNARIRGRNWRQIHPPTHVSYFSRNTMTRMLENNGFEVISIETASYYHTFKNIIGTIAMRKGAAGTLAGPLNRLVGNSIIGRWGFWLNLGDTMFVAARLKN